MKSQIVGATAVVVADQCQTKEIISKEIYDEVMRLKDKKRTRHLLVNVCNSVRADGKKFDVFMKILTKCKSCKDLARSIRRDIKESTDYTTTTPPDLRRRKVETSSVPVGSELVLLIKSTQKESILRRTRCTICKWQDYRVKHNWKT